ncbi:MAG: hypothetical protein QGG40_06275, partial [Myxococcota bacterium]|nr:hypothetical protein [Myxococcota bacterium]
GQPGRVVAYPGAEETVRDCAVVVGAGTTGGVLDPSALRDDAVLVDVALPSSLSAPPSGGVRVLDGEAVAVPEAWIPGAWGRVYHLLAGYGSGQVFACLVEPLVLALSGRIRPYAQGRRVDIGDVLELGERAGELGFVPRLSESGSPVSLD